MPRRSLTAGFVPGQDNFGQDLPAVEAAKKKHEAIETDTAAYRERVQAIEAVAKELEVEGYHDIQRINRRKDNILRLWEQLLELLAARRQRLEMNLALQHLFQEMLHSIDWMDEVKVSHGCLVPPWVGYLHPTRQRQMRCWGAGSGFSVAVGAVHWNW